MAKELLTLFIVCNIVNVIIQTIKSLATVKGSPMVAASVNAVAYGFYTYILIITQCDLPVLYKCIIVAMCNLIGVYVVKKAEEIARKDELWKIEVTVPKDQAPQMLKDIEYYEFSSNYINIGKYYLFNFYCETKEDSKSVKELLDSYDHKYFVSESKIL